MIIGQNGVMRSAAAEVEPLPRTAAPRVTPPVYYNPIIPLQAEIDSLRAQNQEQQRLLELQAREHQQFKDEINIFIATLRQQQQTEVDNLRSANAILANEHQEQRRLLELQVIENRRFKDETNIAIAELRQQQQTEVDDLRLTNVRLANEHQEQRRLLALQATDDRQFKDDTNMAIAELRQILQTKKDAISFLYDKVKDASMVAFSTGNCDVHGEKLPIPDGFKKQHCKFFTSGQGKSRGSGPGDVVPTFQTGDAMVLPYSGNCELSAGAYGVWAAKPVISEQEVAAKKTEYSLTP